MKINLYTSSGSSKKESLDISDKVFMVKPNQHSVYLTINSFMDSQRQGTSSSKTRSEVRGGGIKPWKQKGTGRARIGSTRNPSRVHGGAAFGPRPHKYKSKVNKKVKNIAKKSVLSDLVKSDSLLVLDELKLNSPKTSEAVKILKKLKISDEKILVIYSKPEQNLILGFRNLKWVNVKSIDSFTIFDLLNCNKLLIDKTSIGKIEGRLSD
jgi:large subunit ribosomal protein L4